MMSVQAHHQCCFVGHTEDVTSASCHPDRSGQIGKDDVVMLWSSANIAEGIDQV
jgi:hypothetical protein